MVRVSVILTSFNHEKYLREAIDSILNQTFTDFELIIWDDASADGSWAVISSYSDPRIKAFRNDMPKRGIYGINKAISEVAAGEYLAIHHSDDVWEATKLEKQVVFLDGNLQCGGVFTHAQIINERNEKIDSDWFYSPNKSRHLWLRDLFLETNHLCHPSALIRRSSYAKAGLYRYGLPQTADADMWIRLLQISEIHVIQEKLTLHRHFSNKSNTSADKSETRGRLQIEWHFLKSNYLNIGADDLFVMFPESKQWAGRGENDATFILAMIAVKLGISPGARLFGLNVLFSLIATPERAQRIRELHGFNYFDFIKLTGKCDVFSVEALFERNGEVDRLRNEIDALHKSISWKATAPLRRAHGLFSRLKQRLYATHGVERYQAKILAVPEKSRPRVLHVIGNFLTGGSSRLVVDIFEHLGHLYEQEVVTQYNPVPPNYTDIPVYEFHQHQARELIAYLRRFQPELIHIHYWGSADERWYAEMIKAAHEFGCKVVENINTPVAPLVDASISHYIYVSDYVRNSFGKLDGSSLTIYPGSNLNLFTREASLEIPDDCIGMVYRLDADKLNEQSIDVFIKVVQKRPQTKIVIVGGGAFLEPYKAKVKMHNIENAFDFTGFVPYEKLPSLYAQMSLFVAPVWQESFGQVSPFAMSMGMPVVGYNVGALAEILGNTSLLAPPDDSEALAEIIISLLDDTQRCRQIGQRNRERAHALFSVERMIESYAKLYQESLVQKQ